MLRVVASAIPDSRRVVVTGLGVVSCLGHQPDTLYDALLAGTAGNTLWNAYLCSYFPSLDLVGQNTSTNKFSTISPLDYLSGTSGISTITHFDASTYTTRIAGEIKDFDSGDYISKKMARRIDDTIKYTMVAGKKALEHSGLGYDPTELQSRVDKLRSGILIGSAFGGFKSFADAVEALETQGHRKMNPFCIPFAITNMPGAMLAMDLGFMGPNYPINTACATGNYCIHTAAEHIM